MAKYLVTKWFGAFQCEGRKVSRFLVFPKDSQEIAERIRAMQVGDVLDEEKELSFRGILFTGPRMSAIGKVVEFDSSFILPEDYGFSEGLLRDAMLLAAQMEMSYTVPREKLIIQAVEALDDLTGKANLLAERTLNGADAHVGGWIPFVIASMQNSGNMSFVISPCLFATPFT